MAHAFDASVPTPSPETSRPAGGTRYRRDQFPPAPKSVRIMTVSSEADAPARAAPPPTDPPIAGPDSPTSPSPNGSPAKWVTIATGIVGVVVFLRGCGLMIHHGANLINQLTK
jgi:hypothetical protein